MEILLTQPNVEAIVARIVDRFDVERIIVFGSQARGDAHPESDLDLFIEMKTPLRPVDRVMQVSALFDRRTWGLDLFVYTPDEVCRLRNVHGTLLRGL